MIRIMPKVINMRWWGLYLYHVVFFPPR